MKLAASVALAAMVVSTEASADDAQDVPAFMRNKPQVSAEEVAEKREGHYFTGLPLINSDPDTGIGFGARVYRYENGTKDEPFYDRAPYRSAIYAQAFFTTNGYQYHTLDFDAPYVLGKPYRVRANIAYEANIAANYFGLGDASLGRLRYPGSLQHYASASDFRDAIQQRRPDGTAYTRENQYRLVRPAANITVERDLFGGLVRAAVGIKLAYADVKQWTGRDVDSNSGAAIEAPTRLDRDCAAGLVIGCNSGWDNTLKLGIAYDTRDYEPNPTKGVFVELSGEASGVYTASDWKWARATFSPRFYWTPFPKVSKLTVAGRGLVSLQSSGTPLFELDQLSFADYDRQGLGGLRTLRGFNQDRFVGPIDVLGTLELRWTFYELALAKQRFGLMLVPFLDVGRVFESLGDLEWKRFRNGQGAGFRIAWNQATIIVIDYGVSREGSSLYVNFAHPF